MAPAATRFTARRPRSAPISAILVLTTVPDRAGAEEAALAAREPVGELVGVFGGRGDAEVGEAAPLTFDPAGRFEAGALLQLLPLLIPETRFA